MLTFSESGPFKAQYARDNHKSYIQEMANVLNSHTYFHGSLKAFTIEKTKLRNTCLPYLLINIIMYIILMSQCILL